MAIIDLNRVRRITEDAKQEQVNKVYWSFVNTLRERVENAATQGLNWLSVALDNNELNCRHLLWPLHNRKCLTGSASLIRLFCEGQGLKVRIHEYGYDGGRFNLIISW